jgi:hypothetical protein
MLPPPLLHRKVADGLIMIYCYRTAYWMFEYAMPTIVDTPLMLILITSKQPLCTHNSMQRSKYTVLTPIIEFVCIIVCIQEFFYLSIVDQQISTLSE